MAASATVPAKVSCDYLVLGAGAMGLAFTDNLIAETADTVVIVDNRGLPGGHWNDAYPFVRLHQPSCYYGVNSLRLESGTAKTGELHELATGQEVLAYFSKVMERLVGTGRVQYFPMCTADVAGRIESLVDADKVWEVQVRKRVVDATYMKVEVPAARPPKFTVEDGALLVPPNALPRIARPPPQFVVIGAGKTGVDAVLWLLQSGVSPDGVRWVMPNDAWLYNRARIQPGVFLQTVKVLAHAIIDCKSLQDAYHRLEAEGVLFRIDRWVEPTNFRCSTVTAKEVDQLRQIRDVIRLGHVRRVGIKALELEQGRVATGPGVLHVDCTADALAPREARPIWSGDLISLQSVSLCQQVYSAALISHVEAIYPADEDEGLKNDLLKAVPHPHDVPHIIKGFSLTIRNSETLQRRGLSGWMRRSRLSSFHHESMFNTLWAAFPLRWLTPRFLAKCERMVLDQEAAGEPAVTDALGTEGGPLRNLPSKL